MYKIQTDTEDEMKSLIEQQKHTCIMGRYYCEIEEGNCFKCQKDNLLLQCNGKVFNMEEM